MNLEINIILLAFATTLYFILPAYFSNGGALAFGGGTPVDFGKCDGKGNRWIGDGVTWRGLIAGTVIGVITGTVQGYLAPGIISEIGPYIITPIVTGVNNGILIGFLLGFGALLGDALGSFLKRRLGIAELDICCNCNYFNISNSFNCKHHCLFTWHQGRLVLKRSIKSFLLLI